MLDVGSEHNLSNEGFGHACIHIASNEFEFPDALNPLTYAFERSDVLEQGIWFGMIEGELDHQFLTRSQVTLGVVALEVLCIFLNKHND